MTSRGLWYSGPPEKYEAGWCSPAAALRGMIGGSAEILCPSSHAADMRNEHGHRTNMTSFSWIRQCVKGSEPIPARNEDRWLRLFGLINFQLAAIFKAASTYLIRRKEPKEHDDAFMSRCPAAYALVMLANCSTPQITCLDHRTRFEPTRSNTCTLQLGGSILCNLDNLLALPKGKAQCDFVTSGTDPLQGLKKT